MRGTPLWNAPEVLQRHQFTEKADIYSFAICLWELVTRGVPFQSYHIDTLDRLRQVVCEEHQRPRLPPTTLPAIVALLERLWHRDPAERP